MSRKKAEPKPRASGSGDKEIGLRIRALRIDQHISQEILGKQLNVSFQQIQKYEKGVNRISGVRLVQIAEALNTTPHDLLGWHKPLKTEGTEFDLESYKLARDFRSLSPTLKTHVRQIIRSMHEAGV